MFVFWTVLVALACAATAAVVWPLIRAPRGSPFPGTGQTTAAEPPQRTDNDKRLAVYRDRRREIDAEAAAGRLSADEARLAQDELLAEVAGQFPDGPPPAAAALTATTAPAQRVPLAITILIAVAIPGFAALTYERVGSPGLVGLDASELRGEMSPARLDAAIAELRERTERSATDGEAWAMLAQAHSMKGDLRAAAQAFEQAVKYFSPPSARLLADYADTLVSLRGGEFGPEPVELIERALSINAQEPKALALLGAAQYRRGDFPAALITLRKLRGLLPPDSQQTQQIGEAIGEIETRLSGQPASAPQGAVGAPATPASASTSAAASAPTSAPANTTRMTGRIDIDPALAGKLPPGTTLFVTARLAEGPRMPLAAQRLSPDRFPVTFELSDADAMNPARKPSEAGALVIEARLSRSGNAIRAPGDLLGVSATVRSGSRDIGIRIDQVVP